MVYRERLDMPVKPMETDTEKPKTDTHRVVEQPQPLSNSCLWGLQRDYLPWQGVEAWRQGTVPHTVTRAPFVANACARVVFGFLRDGRTGPAQLDPGQPLYMIEPGAGSGRFAFDFLKKFLARFTGSLLQEIPVKYVMTDFAEAALDDWQAHPWLQSLVVLCGCCSTCSPEEYPAAGPSL